MPVMSYVAPAQGHPAKYCFAGTPQAGALFPVAAAVFVAVGLGLIEL